MILPKPVFMSLLVVWCSVGLAVSANAQKRDILGVATGMTATEAREAAMNHHGQCAIAQKDVVNCKFPEGNELSFFTKNDIVHTMTYDFRYPYSDAEIAGILASTYGIPQERDGTYDFNRPLLTGEALSVVLIHGHASMMIMGLPRAIPMNPKF